MSRSSMEMFQASQKRLVERLLNEPALEQRVERLMRGRQTGAPLEPATGDTACPHIAARPSQPRDLAGGAKACGLSAGRRQEWPPLSGTHSASARKHQG